MSNTPITIMSALTTGASTAYNFDGGVSVGGLTGATIQTVAVYGTFGGATATHQMSPDEGTTWIDIDTLEAVATANKVYNVEARSCATYRISLTSTTTGTTLNAKAFV